MQTRPNHIPPQTIAQARAAYRKYGPRLSEREARQIARGAELQRRADAIRDAERRRKANAQRKAEKEAREREARLRMNIASQKAYVAASQIRLDGFVRVSKGGERGERGEERGVEGEGEDQGKGEDQGEAEEPWEEDGVGDEEFLGILGPAEGPLVDTVPIANETYDIAECEPRVLDKEPSGEQGANALDTGFDEWDDFLVSNTQIEREITTTVVPAPPQHVSFLLPSLSTQDLTFDAEDIDELGLGKTRRTDAEAAARVLMPPPPFVPVRKTQTQPREKLISFSPDDFVLSTQDMRDIDVDARVLMSPPAFVPVWKAQTQPRERLITIPPDDFLLSTQDMRDMRDIEVVVKVLMPPPAFVPVRKAQPQPREKRISFSPDDFVLSTQDMRDIAG